MTVRATGRLLTIFLISVLDILPCISQKVINGSYRFVFYNVENLFDTYDDSTTDDRDFLPGGSMHWTEAKYRRKLDAVYKVVIAAGEWDPPALVGFCEVENKRVLLDLVYNTYLSKYHYGVITGATNDPRGIRNGLIYRKDLVSLLSFKSLGPVSESSEKFTSRKVLYTKLLIGGDTIHMFLNHWPSRRRGVLAEEKVRQSISSVLSFALDSIAASSGQRTRIIIAGDFNCTPNDPEMAGLINNTSSLRNGLLLVNLSAGNDKRKEGTYRYKGTWEMIDQVIVSGYFLNSERGVYTGKDMLKIFRPDFLLIKDSAYPGYSPFPTYKGYKYQGGFSDHLPLILDLKVR